MAVRRLACLDADDNLIGYIVCDSDEAYEQAVKNIQTWSLKNQRPEDLPPLSTVQQDSN